MQFQSWTFLLFFIPVLLLYWAVRGTRLRIPVLLAASYVFYASFNVYFLICLGVVTIVDYLVALQLSRHRSRWLVCVSLLVDLGMLCSFKYIPRVTDFDWVLPVGLSFFTFKSISYVIDVYRGKIAVERNLLAYAAYVAFFPQLVAGPIDRATTLLPQLHHNVPLRIDDVSEGFSLFVTGLFKKAVMADMLAVYVNVVYEDVTSYSGAMRLLAAYAYAWQIYFDFSGYSDMACGVARCMGFRCMLNFNNPYVSVDVRDFWRRWHISLSTWFRDYVYIPMGGSRCGKLRNWFNRHDAGFGRVAWGDMDVRRMGRPARRGQRRFQLVRQERMVREDPENHQADRRVPFHDADVDLLPGGELRRRVRCHSRHRDVGGGRLLLPACAVRFDRPRVDLRIDMGLPFPLDSGDAGGAHRGCRLRARLRPASGRRRQFTVYIPAVLIP